MGGTRSGKSKFAEEMLKDQAIPVTYVATATQVDANMAKRIQLHQQRRSSQGWKTIEFQKGQDLAHIVSIDSPILLDSIGTWLASFDNFEVDIDPLCEVLANREFISVVVSEEVGLSVHPVSSSGRQFIDVLGQTNQRLAQVAEKVFLVIAGQALVIKE